MARHRKLTQKFAGFPIFKVGTSGDTFPVTSPFTTGFTGYEDGLSLDLQFAADKTLTARKGPTPVFTRGSTATFVGSNGLIQSAAINAARFDHDPVTLACKGLLIEESRTNIILQSEDFGTTWIASQSTVSTNVATAPNGLVTADKIIPNLAAGSLSRVAQVFTLTGAHTMSVFAKASEWGWILISYGPISNTGVWFNLTNGTIGTQTAGLVGSIIPYGNGWYKCIVAFTGAGTSLNARVRAVNADNESTLGDGTSGIFVWGAQLEAGSFPTSYIPTTTASLARSADVCSITAGAFSGFWNNSEGSLFASGISRGNLVMASSGTNANQIAIFRNSSPLYMRFDVASGGTYTAQIIGATIADGSFNKTAGSYASNDARAAFNGTLGTPDVTVIVPLTLTTLNIGTGSAGGNPHNGTISAIRYYRKRLDNAKLQAITV